MEQLKKYAAIGGGVSLLLCWPLAVGQIGQTIVKDAVASADYPSVAVEIVDYDRGYLSSTVTTRYTITDPILVEQFELDGLQTSYDLVTDLSHGLISISSHSKLVDVENFPLTIDTDTQLNGNTDFVVSLDNWQYMAEAPEAVKVVTSPIKLTGSVTTLGHIDYQFSLPSLEVEFETAEKFVLNNMQASGSGKQVDGFWFGDQSVHLEGAEVVDPTGEATMAISDTKYTFNAETDEQNERLSTTHLVELSSIKTPEGEATNVVFDFAMGDFNLEAFQQLLAIYQSAVELSPAEVQNLMPYVDVLFSDGFYVGLNKMTLTLGAGEFESKWRIEVPQGTENASQDPMQVLPALTGNLNTFFSTELVEEYPFIRQGVDEAIVMEMVKETPKGYEINATLESGHLVFESGQKVPLLALLFSVMMPQ